VRTQAVSANRALSGPSAVKSRSSESFFGTLKNEMYSLRKWAARDEARNAVIDYIERRRNRNRPHSTIGHEVPAEAVEAFFERTKQTSGSTVLEPACMERMAA
jgi:hypothetical protein